MSDCAKLLVMFPFNMQDRLQKRERLTVTSCYSLNEVFESRGLNESEEYVDVLTISQSDETPPSTSTSQPENMVAKQTPGIQNLTSISISGCGCLRNSIPYSIARGLVKLKNLCYTA